MRLLCNCLLLLVLLFAGCNEALVENPLIKPEESIHVAELNGTYKLKNTPIPLRESWLHIGSAGKNFPIGFHKLVLVIPQSDKEEMRTIECYGFFEKIEVSYFLHIPIAKGDNLSDKQRFPDGWNANDVNKYLLFRFTKSDTGIAIDSLNSNYIVSQIESNALAGTVSLRKATPSISGTEAGDKDTIVIADRDTKLALIQLKPSELRKFLATDASGELYLRRSTTAQKLK